MQSVGIWNIVNVDIENLETRVSEGFRMLLSKQIIVVIGALLTEHV